MTARSYLYVPGDSGDRLWRSTTRGADVVIADLEDSVAPSMRPGARRDVAAWLASAPTTKRWVRVNSGDAALDDLRLIWSPHLNGIVLPKVNGPDDVDTVVAVLDELDSRGPSSGVEIVALVETARALRDLDLIAAHPRIGSLQLGELDLAADLGCHPSADESEMLFARSRVVAASAAAGLEPPVGSVSADFSDLSRFRRSSERLRRLGFVGRATIHPAQVIVANQVFSPARTDIAAARRVLERYAEALSRGEGVVRDRDGTMIDEALVRASRRVLLLASSLHDDAGQEAAP